MRSIIKTEDMTKLTVADAAPAWKIQSEGMDHRHPAFTYTFHPQYNSNVKKYLPHALEIVSSLGNAPGNAGEDLPAKDVSDVMLLAIFDYDSEDIANAARASFLESRHGYDLGKALTLTTAELGLDRNTAKAANGVAEAVRRLIRFFRVWLATCPSVLIKSNWPSTPKNMRRGKATFLMGRIYTEMVGREILDPVDATPRMIADALRIYTEKAFSTEDARHWNCSLGDLRKAVAAGHYPGVTEHHLSELAEIRPNPRNPARTISEADLVTRWPEYFPAKVGDPTHLDPEKGIPGFFNKELAGKAPLNPAGEQCPTERQLHNKAHLVRFRSIRRDIFQSLKKSGGADADLSLPDLFTPERIKERLLDQIEEKGKALHTHRDGYMHALMIAKYYFGYDVGEVVVSVKKDVQFPQAWESIRAEKALRVGTPQTLVEQAEAMGLYAESARRLSSKNPELMSDRPGAGQYLVRKAGQVDCWLRILTGLRPAPLEALEVSNRPDRAGNSPKIWRAQDGSYVVFIPLRYMKQHLKNFRGRHKEDITIGLDHEVKGFEFEIRRAEAVNALNEYLEHGWNHAKAVLEKRTRSLYLNARGESPGETGFGKAFQPLRGEVYHFMLKRHGRETQRHDRYQARHIMSSFIETHLPGRNLKTTYLTHRSDFGADGLYGKTNMTLLREVIDEVLDGKPTWLQQQKEREDKQDQERKDLQELVVALTKALGEKAVA